ncbi:uncharacterized protein LOC122863319 [Xyrichtys novacula]|uniref:Uncharacterized protein LOC122863319 n=1 Tax=Xyrichtys novacula TaxID=13765 RepID=A0AAV1G8K6_XYRNO|nr:uncharacterized protein LOC122863319 [Xyrichtys novacula]
MVGRPIGGRRDGRKDSCSERLGLTPSRLKKSFSQRKMDKRKCLRKQKHIEEQRREEEIEGRLLLQLYVLGRYGAPSAMAHRATCRDLAGPSDTALLAAAAEALLRAAVPQSATPAAATAAVASPPHAGDEPTPPAATTGAQVEGLSCDKAVIAHLKERTLGNSASRLRSILMEEHTRDWMVRCMNYLSVIRKLRDLGQDPQDNAPDGTEEVEEAWEEEDGFQEEELQDLRFADNLSLLLRQAARTA